MYCTRDLYLDMRYSITVYAITILTSPMDRMNSALQLCTNISISNYNKVVGFPRHCHI